RLSQLRLRLRQLAARLIERVLVRARVDGEEQVAGLHQRAFAVVLAHQVAGDPWADLGGHVAHRGADPLAVDRHVALDHRGHLDRRRRGGRRFRRPITSGRNRSDGGEQERCAPPNHSVPADVRPSPPGSACTERILDYRWPPPSIRSSSFSRISMRAASYFSHCGGERMPFSSFSFSSLISRISRIRTSGPDGPDDPLMTGPIFVAYSRL